MELNLDVNWREREFNRFLSGEYTDLPASVYAMMHKLSVQVPFGHFLHLAKDNPSLVAYTENETKGGLDRQTMLKFGRYLSKYFPHLTVPDMAKLSAALRMEVDRPTLYFARSEEDIEWVYTTGPSSCMAHDADEYDSRVHPTRVYAGPDTAIAYTMRDGEVNARTVVNVHTKKYIRVYGDADVLEDLLAEAGYEYSSDALRDVRLLLIEHNSGVYVCPYLDGNNDAVVVENGYLRVQRYGEGHGSSTSGLVFMGAPCGHCEELVDEDSLTWVDSVDERVCQDCLDSHFVYAITGIGRYGRDYEYFPDHWDFVELPDGELMTEDAFNQQDEYVRDGHGSVQDASECVYCEDEGEYYHADDAILYIDSRGDEQYLPRHRKDELIEDCVTQEMILKDDAVETAHGYARAA